MLGPQFLYESNELHFGGKPETVRIRLVLEVINESINHFPSILE
jgi:hypothetical protein